VSTDIFNYPELSTSSLYFKFRHVLYLFFLREKLSLSFLSSLNKFKNLQREVDLTPENTLCIWAGSGVSPKFIEDALSNKVAGYVRLGNLLGLDDFQ